MADWSGSSGYDGTEYPAAEIAALRAENERLRTKNMVLSRSEKQRAEVAEAHVKELEAALRSSVEDNVWSAYAAGVERDGRWMDGGLSDAEWLSTLLDLRRCKWNDADLIKSRIPKAIDAAVAQLLDDARRALGGTSDEG